MAHYIDPYEAEIEMDQYTCIVCSAADRALRFLRCLHSCCDSCLENPGSPIKCPVCDVATDTIGKGLPRNCLQEMSRVRTKLAEPEVCFMCKSFGKSNIGTYVCVTCDQGHICDLCLKAHRVQPATRSHEPIALNELFNKENRDKALDMSKPTPVCADHHTAEFPQPLNFYCETCQVPVCKDCLTLDHRDERHKIVTRKNFARRKVAELEEEKEALIPRQQEVLSRIQTVMKKDEAHELEREELCNEVNANMAALKKIIDDVGAEYLATIARVYDTQKEANRREVAQLKRAEEHMKNVVSVTTKIQEICTDSDMMQHHDFYASCLGHASLPEPSKVINEQVIMEEPVTVTSDEIKGMIGSMKVLECGAPGASIPDPVLDSGLQSKVEIVKSVKIKDFETIYGIAIGHTDSTRVGGDILEYGNILAAGRMRPNTDPCIVVYSSGGQEVGRIEHQIKTIWQIALSKYDTFIYVGNKDGMCVTKLKRSGRTVGTWKTKETWDSYIAVAGGHAFGDFYVASSSTPPKLYRRSGSPMSLQPWAQVVGATLSRPRYLWVTANGVVVSDDVAHSICLINGDGELLFRYGSKGSCDGQLLYPHGLCSDADGKIYIADFRNDRISVVSPEGRFISNIVTKEHGINCPRDVKIWEDRLVVTHSDSMITIFKILA